MFPAINKPLNSTMPLQMVSYKTKFETKKDKFGNTEWMKDSIDALESIGRYVFFNNLELKKNYDIMQGRFNIQDYSDVFDTYDVSSAIYEQMKLPAYLKHYDITTKAVKLLVGEYIKRPDIHKVIAENHEADGETLRIKTDLVKTFIQDEITQEITQKLLSQGIDPNKSEFKTEEEAAQYKEEIQKKYQELTPDSIEKYMRYNFRTSAESWGQAVLSNDLRRFRMKEQDEIEFYDMCVVDRCFSHFFLTPDGYSTEVWNPINTFYEYSSENRYIEEGNYAGRVMYLSKNRVIDLFGWRMTIEQIESLYPEYEKDKRQGNVYSEFFNATLYPFPDYREYDNLQTAIGQAIGAPLDNTVYRGNLFGNHSSFSGGDGYLFTQADLVQVTQVYWKSQRKLGKLVLQNPETGEIKIELVDETFDPKLFGIEVVKETYKDSNEPNTICWTWQTQIWQGMKINVNYQKDQSPDERSAIYVDVRPCDFQFKGSDSALSFKARIPVSGQIFNNRNGRSQSVVDLLKPYQILVNAFYNQAYHVAQKNNGKFFLMGASLLPSVKDWGGEEAQDKFMTTISNMGLGVIDDSLNNTQSGLSMQYGLKVMDMDESDRITRLINLAMLVEQQGFMQLGITPQRQGSVQASETATGTTAAIQNSYAITEIYFEQYANYRTRKLQMMLEMAQFVASKKSDITLPYVTSDGGKAFIEVNGMDLLLKDLGVYVNNSAEQQRKKDLVEQLILKNNQSLMPLSKLIDIIRLDNLSDIQKSLESSEIDQQKQAQAAQQHEAEMQQAQIDAQTAAQDKQLAWESSEAQLDRDADLRKALISASGFDADATKEANGEIDVIAQGQLLIDQQKLNFETSSRMQELNLNRLDTLKKHKLEESKIKTTKDIAKEQNSIKKQEMNNKLKIEKSKLDIVKEQNVSQEKISLAKHKADEQLANKKIELEKIKIRNKPKPTKK